MSSEKSVIASWLEAEEAEAPDCKVIAALKSATKADKLEEQAALKALHTLCEEPPAEHHAAD